MRQRIISPVASSTGHRAMPIHNTNEAKRILEELEVNTNPSYSLVMYTKKDAINGIVPKSVRCFGKFVSIDSSISLSSLIGLVVKL